MDIYSYLKKDHKKVADLFEKVVASRSDVSRKKLLEEIKSELTIHADTEQVTFYKALETAPETSEEIEMAEGEHDEIRDYIKKIGKLPLGSDKWLICLGEFKHCVSHHVEEEETVVFPRAKQVLSAEQAEALAVEMDNLKQSKSEYLKAKAA